MRAQGPGAGRHRAVDSSKPPLALPHILDEGLEERRFFMAIFYTAILKYFINHKLQGLQGERI